MKNADKFKLVFGLYATELWAMPEGEFLKWLNSESTETEQNPEPCEDAVSREAVLDEIYDNIKKCEKALASGVFNEKERFGIECEMKSLEYLLDVFENLPSAQPEILRCKDCKWKQGSECVRFAEVRPFPDDFCSRAERRKQ